MAAAIAQAAADEAVTPHCLPRAEAAASPVAAPPGRLDGLLDGLGLELEINNDKPETTVSWGRKLRPCFSSTGLPGSDLTFRQISLTSALTLPIGGKDDLVDPQTLDKLSNGPSLSFGVSRFSYTSRAAATGIESDPGLQFGAEATLGFNRFDHRAPTTLEELSDDKFQYGAKAFVAIYPNSLQEAFSVSLEYQSAWEAQDDTILCKPVIVTPADDCVSAAPGGPERTDGLLLGAEYRRAFDTGWSFGDLAVSPLVTYDLLNDEVGIELPVYLLVHGETKVLPGFKIGYSTEEDVTYGVFLKSSFTLGF